MWNPTARKKGLLLSDFMISIAFSACVKDKIDFDKLKRTLGEDIDEGEERFGMTWPGKNDCFKVIQTPSIGTLKPCKEESVDWNNTENLFIEGDIIGENR